MAALRCHVWCRGLRAQRLARLTRPCSVLKAAWETLNLAPALGGKRQCGQGGCLAAVRHRGQPCEPRDRKSLGMLPHAQLCVNLLCCVCLGSWIHLSVGSTHTQCACNSRQLLGPSLGKLQQLLSACWRHGDTGQLWSLLHCVSQLPKLWRIFVLLP